MDYLERIEALMSEARGGADVRLADEFDLIGGTSTGAIIATALTIGLKAREIRDFYLELAPKIFRHSRLRLVGFQAKFDARVLEAELRRIVGDMRLDDPRLLTNWAVMTKRMDTGSAWIVGNNPHSRWWDDPPDEAWVGNRHYRVADLVRASAAAPFYFRPQSIRIVEGEPPGLFIDGGLTPHNNPSLALLQWATLPAHGYGWETGCKSLTILSIGTGVARPRHRAGVGSRWISGKFALDALTAMVSDAEEQIVTTMQVFGRSLRPRRINAEIGDLAGHVWPQVPLFDYLRLNVRLEGDWLAEELGMAFFRSETAGMARLDAADRIQPLYEIGGRAAETQITPDLVADLFDPSVASPWAALAPRQDRRKTARRAVSDLPDIVDAARSVLNADEDQDVDHRSRNTVVQGVEGQSGRNRSVAATAACRAKEHTDILFACDHIPPRRLHQPSQMPKYRRLDLSFRVGRKPCSRC